MLSFLTRVIAPTHCLLCEDLLRSAEQSLCQICLAAQPRCSELEQERLTRVASTVKVTFRAALINTASVSTMCHSFKYGGNPWIAEYLGNQVMGPILNEYSSFEYVLVPMPISRKRFRQRGYNQSEKLAVGLLHYLTSNGLKASIVHVLEKVSERKSQVNMNPFERWTNPKGSVRVRQKIKQRIPGDALLVMIDDTVTTGSTLIHAAEIIRKEFPEQPLHLLALALEV